MVAGLMDVSSVYSGDLSLHTSIGPRHVGPGGGLVRDFPSMSVHLRR
jgi:hypothetical protein